MSTLSLEAPMAPRSFVAKAGTFAAGTALAGAALLGGTTVAPSVSAGLSASVHQDYALTALGDGTSFADAVQNALAGIHLGTIGQLIGLLGANEDGTPLYDADTPLYVDAITDEDGTVTTPASGLLVDLLSINGTPLTLGGVSDEFLGLSLTDPIWSSDAGTDSLLGTGSILTMPDADGVATPIGDLSIGQLLTDLLGGDVTTKTVGALFNGIGMGGLVGFVTMLCEPGEDACVPNLLDPSLGVNTLTADSSVSDLVASLLGLDDTNVTLGAFLQGLDPDLTDGSLADLLNLPAGDTLAEMLAGMTLGGSVLGDPGVELGDLSLGGLFGALTGDSDFSVDDDTLTGAFLEAMGLFGTV